MASTQVLTTPSTTQEQVSEPSIEERSTAEEAPRGLLRALRWRVQNVFWNYMGLQAQLGIYGGPDDTGET